jgi:hypothetical protein
MKTAKAGAIARRKKTAGRLLAAGGRARSATDFVGRAMAVWGARPAGEALSEILSLSRGDR